jgi:hypothetical protein
MAFEDITDPEAVRRAIEEFEALGQARFLKRYNFGASRGWMLRDGDREYDAKAILGAAHGYQHPALGPLPYDQFHGGVPRVSGRVLAWKRSLCGSIRGGAAASFVMARPCVAGTLLCSPARQSSYPRRYPGWPGGAQQFRAERGEQTVEPASP